MAVSLSLAGDANSRACVEGDSSSTESRTVFMIDFGGELAGAELRNMKQCTYV